MIENNIQCDDPHKVETFGNPKILILGHGRHGKDTVAGMINKFKGYKFSSSSWAALDVIWPCLQEFIRYTNKEEAYEDRHNHRELWKRLISLYNTPDKSALCRHIFKNNDIYVGMRCNKEFEACRHLFDLIVWVEDYRKPIDSTMKISKENLYGGVYLIDNNGSLEYLEESVKNLCLSL